MSGLAIAVATVMATMAVSGMSIPDQWGNPWLAQETYNDGRTVVSIYDCAGNKRAIGTLAPHDTGIDSNFAGFHPYLSATLNDLSVVSLEVAWERRCLKGRCQPSPQRFDCRVVETPTGNLPPAPPDAWMTWQAMHRRK
jgi:hypothetical protein